MSGFCKIAQMSCGLNQLMLLFGKKLKLVEMTTYQKRLVHKTTFTKEKAYSQTIR